MIVTIGQQPFPMRRFTSKRARGACNPAERGLTILELLIGATIIAILSTMAMVNYHRAMTRAKVSASKNQLRTLAGAIETYRLDNGTYPAPRVDPLEDPFGVVSSSALSRLTTPIAYVGRSAFRDPFGNLRLQTGAFANSSTFFDDPFKPPTPGFNTGQALLYFNYPHLSSYIGDAALRAEAYAVVSVGPDLMDSFIVYYPFPASLPRNAAQFGVSRVEDSVYDPTNGTTSRGDLAAFGGEISVARLVGGGGP